MEKQGQECQDSTGAAAFGTLNNKLNNQTECHGPNNQHQHATPLYHRQAASLPSPPLSPATAVVHTCATEMTESVTPTTGFTTAPTRPFPTPLKNPPMPPFLAPLTGAEKIPDTPEAKPPAISLPPYQTRTKQPELQPMGRRVEHSTFWPTSRCAAWG